MSKLFNLNLKRYSDEIQRHHRRSFLIKHEVLTTPILRTHYFASDTVKQCIKFDQLCLNFLTTNDADAGSVVECGRSLVSQSRLANDVFYTRRYLVFYWYFKLGRIHFSESKELKTWFSNVLIRLKLPVLEQAVCLRKDEKKLIERVLNGDIAQLSALKKTRAFGQIKSYLDATLMEILTFIIEFDRNVSQQPFNLTQAMKTLTTLSYKVRVSGHRFDYMQVDAVLECLVPSDVNESVQRMLNNIDLDQSIYQKLPHTHQLLSNIVRSIEHAQQEKIATEFKQCLQVQYPWQSLQRWVNTHIGLAMQLDQAQSYEEFGIQLYKLVDAIIKVPVFDELDIGSGIDVDLKELVLFYRSIVHAEKQQYFVSKLWLFMVFSTPLKCALAVRWKDHHYRVCVDQLLANPYEMLNQAYSELLLAKSILLNCISDAQLRSLSKDDWSALPETLAHKIYLKMENEQASDLQKRDSERFLSHWFKLPDFLKTQTIKRVNTIVKVCFDYLNGDIITKALLTQVDLNDHVAQSALGQQGVDKLGDELPVLIAATESESDSSRYLAWFFTQREHPKQHEIFGLLSALTYPKLNIHPFSLMATHLHDELLLLHQFLSWILTPKESSKAQEWLNLCAALQPYQSVVSYLRANWQIQVTDFLQNRLNDVENVSQIKMVLNFCSVMGIEIDRKCPPTTLLGLDKKLVKFSHDIDVYYRGWLDGNVDVMVMIRKLYRYRHTVNNDELQVFAYFFSEFSSDLNGCYSQLDDLSEKLPSVLDWVVLHSADSEETFLQGLRRLITQMKQFQREYELNGEALLSNDLAVSTHSWVTQNLPMMLRDELYLTALYLHLDAKDFASGFYVENVENGFAQLKTILLRPSYQTVLAASSLEYIKALANILDTITPQLVNLANINARIQRLVLLGTSGFNIRIKSMEKSWLTNSKELSRQIKYALDSMAETS